MLSMTPKAYDNLYWFEEACFKSETNGFCSNSVLMVKRFNVFHDSQSLGSSVLIWRGLLRFWSQRFLQQPFSYGETNRCCPWHWKPRIIGTDLKRSASNKNNLLWSVSMLPTATNTYDNRYWFEEVCFEYETNDFYSNHYLMVKRVNVVHATRRIRYVPEKNDNRTVWDALLTWARWTFVPLPPWRRSGGT